MRIIIFSLCVCTLILIQILGGVCLVIEQPTPCLEMAGNLFPGTSCQINPEYWYGDVSLPPPYGLVPGPEQFSFAVSLRMNSYNFSKVSVEAPQENSTYIFQISVKGSGRSGLGIYWGVDGVNFPNFIASLIDVQYVGDAYVQYSFPFVVGAVPSFYVGLVGFNKYGFMLNYGAVLLLGNSTNISRLPLAPFASASVGLNSISLEFGSTDVAAMIDYFVVQLLLNDASISTTNISFTSTTLFHSYDNLIAGKTYKVIISPHNALGVGPSNIIWELVPLSIPDALPIQYSAGLSLNTGLLHRPYMSADQLGYTLSATYVLNVSGSDGSFNSTQSQLAGFADIPMPGLLEGVYYEATVALVNAAGQGNSTSVAFTYIPLPQILGTEFALKYYTRFWFSASSSQLQLKDSSVHSWQPWYFLVDTDTYGKAFQQSSDAFNGYLPTVDNVQSPTRLDFKGNSFLPFFLQNGGWDDGVNEIIGVWNYDPNALQDNCIGFFFGGTRAYGNSVTNFIGDPSTSFGSSIVYLNGTGVGFASNTAFFSHPTIVTIRRAPYDNWILVGSHGSQLGSTLGGRPDLASGSFPTNGSDAFCGSVSEFIGFNADLDDVTRRAFEDYLGEKYNIPINRPNCSIFHDCNTNGVCLANNSCMCLNNFAGESCADCLPGYYHVNPVTCGRCSYCGHGHCDPNDGHCICDKGWGGYSCSQCNPGLFGPNCTAVPGVTNVIVPYPLYDVGGQVITVQGANFLFDSSYEYGVCIFQSTNFYSQQFAFQLTNTTFRCPTPQMNAGGYTLQLALWTFGGLVPIKYVQPGVSLYLNVVGKCPDGNQFYPLCSGNGYCALGTCICSTAAGAWGRICNETQTLTAYNQVKVSQAGVGSVSGFFLKAIQKSDEPVPYLWQVEGLPSGVTGRFQKPLSVGSDGNVLEIEISPTAAKGVKYLQVLTVSPTFTVSVSVYLNIGNV